MNVLIIKQTSLGDVLHSTVALSIIKENYPDAKITFLTDKGSYDLIKHNKKIHNFILADVRKWERDFLKDAFGVLKDIKRVAKEVDKRRYDIAFDLQGLSRSAFFLYLAKAKEKYVKGHFPLLKGYRKRDGHAIDEIVNVLKLSGISVNKVQMEIALSDEEREEAEKIIQMNSPHGSKIICISPFTRWYTKDWPLSKYKELIERLSDNYTVFLTGSKEKENELDLLIEGLKRENVYNLAGKINLLVFSEIIKRSSLLLSGEGFPVHVASAFNTPLVVLYGPTSEKRVGPLSESAHILRSETCEKAPCYKRTCANKKCMNDISVDDVLKKIEEVLK